MLLLGRAWFLSSLLFYTGIAYLIYLVYSAIIKKTSSTNADKKTKYFKYSAIIIVSCILVLEGGIRIFTKKYHSYTELNYGLFYISPFSDGLSNLKMKLFGDETAKTLKTHTANSTNIFKTSDFSHTHTYNEFGLRERTSLLELIKEKTVILTIGDSFTECVGTSQDETWQRHLENQINSTAYTTHIVINAGISGYNPSDELELLQKLLPILKPEFVIISIGSNDLVDISNFELSGGLKNSNRVLSKQTLGYYIYSWSFIFRVFSHAIFDYPEFPLNEKDYLRSIDNSKNEIIKILKNIVTLSQSYSFKPILVIYPTQYEVETSDYIYSQMHELVQEMQLEDGIISVDILDFFRKNKNSFFISPSEMYWRCDKHMTPLGYSIWGDILYSEFRKNYLIEKNNNN
jgi:lysophospholipase L1-like esterase